LAIGGYRAPASVSICGMQATPKACSVSACALQLTHKHMLAPYNRIQVDGCNPQASSQVDDYSFMIQVMQVVDSQRLFALPPLSRDLMKPQRFRGLREALYFDYKEENVDFACTHWPGCYD
jgi:hypothetical protein